LDISLLHAAAVATLPFENRDPFDRLLIAPSSTEQIPLLSADTAFDT
jgi:PIN domain nuclease of toxin-antitoxin system